jgi:hypothetical protein
LSGTRASPDLQIAAEVDSARTSCMNGGGPVAFQPSCQLARRSYVRMSRDMCGIGMDLKIAPEASSPDSSRSNAPLGV